MYIRTFFLSSPKRIAEIKKLYQVELPETLLHQYFLHIQKPTNVVAINLQSMQKENKDYRNFFSPNRTQIMIPLLSNVELPHYLKQILSYQNLLNENNFIDPWTVRDQVLNFNDGPILMGILNVTPDSFSDGGLFNKPDKGVERALIMEAEGAKIIDIGGESSRPGSDPVSEQEEISRVIPVIKGIRSQSGILISIDTTKSEVARRALDAGADIVNDISALKYDPKMVDVVRAVDCPVVIMHMQGTPKSMQDNPAYVDVSAEVYAYFQDRISDLRKAGVKQIAIDPGIGFGKRPEDNLHLLRDLKDFNAFNLPILIGLSRKAFIGTVLDRSTDQRLSGTLAAHIFSVNQGASIFRVHDVQETKDAIKMYKAIAES